MTLRNRVSSTSFFLRICAPPHMPFIRFYSFVSVAVQCRAVRARPSQSLSLFHVCLHLCTVVYMFLGDILDR